MDALGKATAADYDDAAELKKDTSLDAVRGRDGFHKLLAALEAVKKK
jgi:hypothetical protein